MYNYPMPVKTLRQNELWRVILDDENSTHLYQVLCDGLEYRNEDEAVSCSCVYLGVRYAYNIVCERT